ncbi:lipopolysaccharide biosynthesis protein [Acinetobacter indicus]|uniref:lipopolysaccharide biosynthesis protein n=1 Tax=Acinetobacter indicus TaxID=756892 RepID=UPI000CECC06F|nr:oligosaccharide flippase family protein [Acinetobacter indicus]
MKSLLDKVNAKLNAQGGFLKAISIIISGTILAQLITFIFLPIITRLYSPENFNNLATYTAIVAILSTISCMRLEIAIAMPKNKIKALDLLFLSIFSLCTFIVITTIVIVLFFIFYNGDESNSLHSYLWLIPIGVLFISIYTILQFWASRNKDFKLIANTRIKQSFISSVIQILFGYLGFLNIGLIFGHVLQSAAGSGNLIKKYKNELYGYIKNKQYLLIFETLKEYKDYPKYSTWEALMNVCSIQLPILIISLLVDVVAGFILLATKILAAPMKLLGSAVSQAYLPYAAEKDTSLLYYFTIKTIKGLLKVSIVPFLLIAIVSPIVIPFIFGEQWEEVGFIISILVPFYFMQFLVSPVSMAIHVTKNQKIALYLQFFGLFIRVVPILYFSLYWGEYVIYSYAVTGFLFYFVYLITILNILRKYKV